MTRYSALGYERRALSFLLARAIDPIGEFIERFSLSPLAALAVRTRLSIERILRVEFGAQYFQNKAHFFYICVII